MNNPIALSFFCATLAVMSVSSLAQSPTRLQITTGVSGGQTFFHADKTLWMADGSIVYRNTPKLLNSWRPLPQLYKCGPAIIVRASPTRVSVVTKRMTQADSSWWMFESSDSAEFWQDSVAISAQGAFLGSTSRWLLFSSSPQDTEMVVSVWRYDGTFATTVLIPRARNTPFTWAKPCGDSMIIADPARETPAYDVIRGIDREPTQWTVTTLNDVRFGIVGVRNNSFVYQTPNGSFIDVNGSVKPIAVMADRLPDLFVDGQQGARIARGGVEYAPDLTRDSVVLTHYNPGGLFNPGLLYSGTDRVFTLQGLYQAGVVRDGRSLHVGDYYVDSGSGTAFILTPFIDGTISRGSRFIVSGLSVGVAGLYRIPSYWYSVPVVAQFIPGSNEVAVDTLVDVADNPTMFRRVHDETWLGTSQGVVTIPQLSLVSNRPAYDAIGDADRAFILTQRGIEVRQGADTAFQVFVPEPSIAGFALAGDTLVVIRIEDITTGVPEARWVADAYDRLGNAYFYGALLEDSVVAKGLRFRSINTTDFGLLVNGTMKLFQSVNGGASWTSLSPGLILTTALSIYEDRVCAWGITPDGTEGPSLMITPDRWIVQPTLLRTPTPVLACASMPGWFVFSTTDGNWSLKQTISNVYEGADNSSTFDNETSVITSTQMYDLMGRCVQTEGNNPTGWYVVVERSGHNVRSRIRLISR